MKHLFLVIIVPFLTIKPCYAFFEKDYATEKEAVGQSFSSTIPIVILGSAFLLTKIFYRSTPEEIKIYKSIFLVIAGSWFERKFW